MSPAGGAAAWAGAAAALTGVEDPAETARLTAAATRIAGGVGPAARAGLAAGALALDACAVAGTGHRLAALPPARRYQVLARVSARPAGARLVDGLKLPALIAAAAALAADPAPGANGADGAAGGGQARPEPELDCTPAHAWPSCSTADAVVVGSGAGGAFAARTLARRGLAVVVVEEGRRHTAADLAARPPLDRLLDLYRDGGATVAFGRPPVLLPVGRAVGGTTLVNSGTCYRTPADVLRRWRDGRGVALADPDHFGTHLAEVEATLRVAPQPLDVLGTNGRLALAGAQRLGWQAAPLRRNAPGCAGSCQCAVGCPRNAKNGVHLSVLPDACAAGARILVQARVRRVLVDRGRAVGVEVSRPDGTRLRVLAPLVVVAAGATETPPLLRRSGLGAHPGLGRHLAVHPAVTLAGRFAAPVTAWSGVLQSVGVEQFRADGILIEATAAPRGLATFPLPGLGPRLRAELAGTDRLATLGAMVADLPSGRVYGRGRSVLRYDLAPRDAARLRRALAAMGRILFAAGATEVLTGLAGRPRATSPAELDALVAAVDPRELHVSAFHPTGTARLGGDPQRDPADPSGWLRGVTGVLVADASALPSCPEVNPQLTVMALASAVAAAAFPAG